MKSTSFLKFLSGSFSSSCLIFKVQFRCLSQDSLLSISHHLRFVNTFFQLFSKFFPAFSKFCFCDIPFSQTLAPLPRRAFVYRILSLVFPLVNIFFDLFPLLFSLLVHPSVCFWVVRCFIYYILYIFSVFIFLLYMWLYKKQSSPLSDCLVIYGVCFACLLYLDIFY